MALNAATDFTDWLVSVVKGIAAGRKNAVGGNLQVAIEASGEMTLLQAGSAEVFKNLAELAAGLRVSPSRRADVILGKGLYFTQMLSPAQLPRSRALALASLDIDANFPFLATGNQLFACYGRRGTQYVVVRTDILEPIHSAVCKNGRTISSLLIDGHSKLLPLKTSMADVRWWRHATAFKFILPRAAFALVAFCLLVTATHMYVRNSIAMAELDDLIGAKQEIVSTIIKKNKELNDLTKLQQQARSTKTGVRPTSAMLDDLTDLLPDTTWLTDLSLSGSEVIISGYSEEAATLISILDRSTSFRDAAFTSQVTRTPGQGGERFSIRMVANADQ